MKNKRILLIMPYFFQYETRISEKLREMGAEVYMIDTNVHAYGIFRKFACFYTKSLRKKLVRAYYEEALKAVPEVDTVFVIKGQWMDAELMQYLRGRYQKAEFVFYLWDSIATCPDQGKLVPYFDRYYTFDMVDAETYGWPYRPNFFIRENVLASSQVSDQFDLSKKNYDLLFVSSMHTRRLRVWQEFAAIAKKQKLRMYSYIYVPRLQYIRDCIFRKDPLYKGSKEVLHFTPLPFDETVKKCNDTKCICDYTFPNQNGFCMRAIDTIGYKCKLITNNKHILDADFYAPENIYVYDTDLTDIPEDFLKTPYHELPQEIYDKYSLDGWLLEILGKESR